jgi:plastocyanin
MPRRLKLDIAIIAAIAIGISYLLFLVLVTPFMDNAWQQPLSEPAISTVVFVEDASLPTAPNNGIEPKVITVVIGVNNTVRWVNQDTIPHGIPIPDDDNVDPDFAKLVEMKYSGNGSGSFLMPKDSFEYTFMHPGRIDYHMVPHPQMKGTVIVLPASEK